MKRNFVQKVQHYDCTPYLLGASCYTGHLTAVMLNFTASVMRWAKQVLQEKKNHQGTPFPSFTTACLRCAHNVICHVSCVRFETAALVAAIGDMDNFIDVYHAMYRAVMEVKRDAILYHVISACVLSFRDARDCSCQAKSVLFTPRQHCSVLGCDMCDADRIEAKHRLNR